MSRRNSQTRLLDEENIDTEKQVGVARKVTAKERLLEISGYNKSTQEEAREAAGGFGLLPYDVISQILNDLDTKSLSRLMRTCKHMVWSITLMDDETFRKRLVAPRLNRMLLMSYSQQVDGFDLMSLHNKASILPQGYNGEYSFDPISRAAMQDSNVYEQSKLYFKEHADVPRIADRRSISRVMLKLLLVLGVVVTGISVFILCLFTQQQSSVFFVPLVLLDSVLYFFCIVAFTFSAANDEINWSRRFELKNKIENGQNNVFRLYQDRKDSSDDAEAGSEHEALEV